MEDPNHKPEGEREGRELAPLSIIRTETVLSRLPIHNLAKKGAVDIQIVRKTGKGEVELRWEVSYNSRYGQPRQLAYKLDTLIVNRRIEEAGRPLPKMIRLGSLREIAEELGLGGDTNSIKKALRQNATTAINAKLDYKGNDGSERQLEALFTRYSVIFTGEKLPDGSKANSVYLILNEPYQDVVNNSPVRPLDWHYMRSLKPAAQRFYEIVSRKIFAALKHGHEEATLRYSEYCTYSAQQRYRDYDRFKKQMYKVHRPHLKSGYIATVANSPATDEDGNPDWLLRYTPGPKAEAEYQAFSGTPRPRRPRKFSPVLRDVRRNAKTSETEEFNESQTFETRPELQPSVDQALLDELTTRGVMSPSALLASLSPDHLERVRDYIEYWDSITAEKGPGLLVNFIRNSDPLPAGFESSRQRRARVEQEAKLSRLRQAKQALEVAYQEYKAEALNRYVDHELPRHEYDRLYRLHKEDLSRQGNFFASFVGKPEFDSYVHRSVLGELSKTLNVLPFDDFRRREADHILARYGIAPAELGIPVGPKESLPGSTGTLESSTLDQTHTDSPHHT